MAVTPILATCKIVVSLGFHVFGLISDIFIALVFFFLYSVKSNLVCFILVKHLSSLFLVIVIENYFTIPIVVS